MVEKLIKIFDRICSVNITCSIGDVMLCGDELDEGQLTILSRYYDILQFKEENRLFPFQNTLSKILWGEAHNEEDGNRNFLSLIESYEKEGYRTSSRIIVDNRVSMMNGTHRVAMNLYFGYWKIEARMVKRKISNRRNVQWYVEKGLSNNWIDTLEIIHKQITDKIFNKGATFVIVTELLSSEQHLNIHNIIRSRTKEYRQFVLSNGTGGLMILYSLAVPKYIVRKGKLLSLTAQRLCQDLSNNQIHIKECVYNCLEGMKLFEKYKEMIICL